MRWIASFIALAVLVGVAVTLYQSMSLPAGMSDVAGLSYPSVILIATGIFAVLHAVSALRGRVLVSPHIDFSEGNPARISRFIAAIGLWIGYIALLPVVGFVIASFFVIALSLIMLARIRIDIALVCAFLFVLIFNGLFRYVLYVSTPQGPLDIWIDTFVYGLLR